MKALLVNTLLFLLTFCCFEISLTAGQIWAWGDNTWGQTNVPSGLTNAVAISVGSQHAVAVKADGTVIAWGDNSYGQCEVPSNATQVVSIAAGALHTLALQADGSVLAWGGNADGRCNVPSTLGACVAVSAGGYHSVALRADGRVVAWGKNDVQQCSVPSDLTNVVAVAASGGAHTLGLRIDGTVSAWGSDWSGESQVPVGLTNVIAISTGTYHSLALRADGTVAAWGSNEYGECNVPVDLTNVVDICGGTFCSLALKADRTLIGWSQTEKLPEPLINISFPPELTNVTAISSGGLRLSHLALVGFPQDDVSISFVSPKAQTVFAGSQAIFSVGASGAAPLSYQWYSFGTNAIGGATNRWLALPNAHPSQSGTYTVVVSNAQGFATSQAVTLEVLLSLNIANVPGIQLNGDIGATYRIDYFPRAVVTGNWTPLATITLTNNQQYYCDLSAIGQPARFYRLVQVP